MTAEVRTSSGVVIERTGRIRLLVVWSLVMGLVVTTLLGATAAIAHHSYAMFDMSKSVVVQGTVAKHEWVNPHTFVWLYVEKKDQPGQHDLYAFENGPIGLLIRQGWSKDTITAGEKISVQYFPLKDGRTGGYFIKAIYADGKERIGDPFAPGVAEAAKNTPALP